MTREEFIKIYTDNPNDESVLNEINRLYESEEQLTADFVAADSERESLKQQLNDANKKYRERFLSGASEEDLDSDHAKPVTFDDLFKE